MLQVEGKRLGVAGVTLVAGAGGDHKRLPRGPKYSCNVLVLAQTAQSLSYGNGMAGVFSPPCQCFTPARDLCTASCVDSPTNAPCYYSGPPACQAPSNGYSRHAIATQSIRLLRDTWALLYHGRLEPQARGPLSAGSRAEGVGQGRAALCTSRGRRARAPPSCGGASAVCGSEQMAGGTVTAGRVRAA